MPSNELFRASAKIEPRAVAFKGEPELPSSFDAGAVVIHFPPFGNGGFAEDLRISFQLRSSFEDFSFPLTYLGGDTG